MKDFYKMIIFLAMFQMTTLVIAGINVFPEGTTLYSDLDLNTLSSYASDPISILSYLFLPSGGVGTFTLTDFTLSALIILIVLGGSAVAIATHSYVPAVLAILGISFIPMVMRSLSFFERLFTQWDSVAITYLFIMIGLGVLMMFVFMIIETPTHGGS